MSNQTGGYGPPRIQGYSAERVSPPATEGAPAAVTAPLARIAAAPSGAGKIRFTLHGEGFLHRAMPLVVQIGDRLFFDCTISPDETTVVCLLDELPEEGAVIRVGYGRDEMTELPERFSHSRLAGENPNEV